MKTYAIGDIHGKHDQLLRLLDWVEHDAGTEDALVLFLGDYIDRGPQSKEVLDTLIAGPKIDKHRWVFLRGNHEQMMLDARHDSTHWERDGGIQTLGSFGTRELEEIPADYWIFLRNTIHYFEDEHRIFVHAGLYPGLTIKEIQVKGPSVFLWIREEFLNSDCDWGKTVIHGHTPVHYDPKKNWDDEQWAPVIAYPFNSQKPNRINIDTGAVFGGKLTAARWEDGSNVPIFHQVGY